MLKKKGSWLISAWLVMVLILSFALSGCAGGGQSASPSASATPTGTQTSTASTGAVKEVKIGFVWPLSGGSASIGKEHNDGALMAIDEINQNGGIKSLGGAKIVPVVADSQTKPDVGCTQVERLITQEKVPIVVGCYNSSVTFPASEVAERYQTPFISQGGVKNEITQRGFKWVFRVNNMEDYDVKETFDAIDSFIKETGQGPKTFALLYESTDWGMGYAFGCKREGLKRGWTCVLDEPYAEGVSDMTPMVLKIKSANPDILFVASYTPDAILFQKAMYENKVYIPFGIQASGGGHQDPAFFAAVPPESVAYLFVQDDWDSSLPKKYDWVAKIGEEVKAKLGYEMNDFFAQGWTAAYVAYYALEKAGSTDKEAIRKALTELDLTFPSGHALLTGVKGIKFDNTGQNIYIGGTISQRSADGKSKVVLWPPENKEPGAQVVWPIPKP